MKRNSYIHVRLDDKLKEEFSDVCEDMGLSITTVIKLLVLKTVREGGISLDIEVDGNGARQKD